MGHACAVSDDEEQQIVQQLSELSRQNGKRLRREARARQQQLTEDIHELWRDRRLAGASRLCRRVGGTRFGPKRRDYLSIRGVVASASELVADFSRPGAEGG
eukprot:3553550-Pyramimonas_sp.AAC.1